MSRTRKSPAQLQREVDQWNDRVKIGDRVLYSEVLGMTESKEYVIATAAELLSGHTPVVWLEGKSGCVAISHCTPVAGAA